MRQRVRQVPSFTTLTMRYNRLIGGDSDLVEYEEELEEAVFEEEFPDREAACRVFWRVFDQSTSLELLASYRDLFLEIKLFGDFATILDHSEIMEQNSYSPVVIALGGMSISQFRGSLSLINSSATRIVVNPAIPEAVELTCRFASTPRKISLLPIKYDSPQKAHAHLEASKRTIQQLMDMRASNSSDQTKYRCHASVVSIDTSSRWVYLGCSECYCSVTICEPDFWCATHDRIPPSETKHCFKIRFAVSDETALAHFLLLGKTAENIIPATADDLFRNFPRLDDCLPPELELFLMKEFTFDV
ncbi:hypothetical protein LINPERPRIM_LOCUS13408 [Linum perenne]